MTYKEAQKEAHNRLWKIERCPQGKECWCRIISLVQPIEYLTEKGETELYESIVGSGSLDTATARYIVNLHNKQPHVKFVPDGKLWGNIVTDIDEIENNFEKLKKKLGGN